MMHLSGEEECARRELARNSHASQQFARLIAGSPAYVPQPTECRLTFGSNAGMMSSVPPCSPPIRDQTYFPWNWHEVAVSVDLQSPRAGTAASEGRPASPHTPTTPHGDGQRRGRPRLDAITSLIREGSSSPSSIKCNVCNRVFPREKSLQAHMRTHTGKVQLSC